MKPSTRREPISHDQEPLVPATSKRANQSNIDPRNPRGNQALNIDPQPSAPKGATINRPKV